MDLAVEYLVRGGECEALLSLPVSVFLLDDQSKRHVLTVNACYGPKDKIALKYYDLAAVPRGTKTPDFTEYVVDRDNLFNTKAIEGQKFHIIPYLPPAFPLHNMTMVGDEPEAARQEKAFNKFYETYYRSDTHTQQRTQFLWTAFVDTQIDAELKKAYRHDGVNIILPQAIISQNDRATWGIWNAWRKILFLDMAGPAGELVFSRCFKPLTDEQKTKFGRPHPWWYY